VLKQQIDISNEFNSTKLKEAYYKRIKNKSGKGIDGVTTTTFEKSINKNLDSIAEKIAGQKYRFSPYLQLLKSKGSGKNPRVISKPTIKDKITLNIMKDILHESFPTSVPRLLPNIYIRKLKEFMKTVNISEYSFIKLDIVNFYDSLDRELLMNTIKSGIGTEEYITLLRRAIINKTVPLNCKKNKKHLFATTKGVPQGLSISNALANLYMKSFDDKHKSNDYAYFRYVDDILIIAKTNMIKAIEHNTINDLEKIELTTHPLKNKTDPMSVSFDYLGYSISSNDVSVKESTIDGFIQSVLSIFTNFKHNHERWVDHTNGITVEKVRETFILKLNEKITGAISDKKRYGWVFYFLEINDVELLHKLDSIVTSFFYRLDEFDRIPPKNIKKFVKTYYEAKHNIQSGYIHNYDSYETLEEKLDYLIKYGVILDLNRTYSPNEIKALFEKSKHSHLMKLEQDLGIIS